MTFTKEQLQHIIETDHVQRGDASALACMALAGMEAEPVAWVMKDDLSDKNIISTPAYITAEDAAERTIGELQALYSAPQPLTTSERAELENYRNAQQVVPDVMDDAGGVCCEVSYADGWNACRAAMQGKSDGTLANEGTIPTTQFKPVADLYGLTPPTCGETSFTFDAVEARDFISGGYSVQEYVELERFQAAMTNQSEQVLDMVNSPVIPDGWVMVPVEPTEEMLDEFDSIIDYGAEDSKDAWSRLIAAAPQQEISK